jgi:hypothetical protein
MNLGFSVGRRAHCRSLGFARDDKKERVAGRERTVVKGQSSCWGGEGALSIDNRTPSTAQAFSARAKKSEALGMTEQKAVVRGEATEQKEMFFGSRTRPRKRRGQRL